MTRFTLPIALLLLAVTCSKGSDEEAGASEYFYDCDDAMKPAGLTIYATDEAYREYLDKVAATGFKKDSTQAPQLMTPAADSTISVATPPAFSFTSGMTLRTKENTTPMPRTPPRRSRWAWLKDAFSLEGTAWAHCPNVTGPLYLVRITELGQTTPAYVALASVTSFTPAAAVWKEKLQPLSGKKVTLTLARGVFSMGHLELGPFVADKDITLSVVP
jgi:hypothetical protein